MAISAITYGGATVLYGTRAAPEAALFSVGVKALLTKFPYGQPNFTLAPIDDVYQSLAARLNRPFQKTLFNVGPPVTLDPADTDGGFNTSISVSCVDQKLYSGSTDVLYSRYDATVLTTDVNLDLLRYKPEITTIHGAVGEYNRVFGTKLQTADFEDGPIPTEGETYFKATASSYHFIPGTKVPVGVLVMSDRDLEIRGLSWPAKTVAARQAYFNKDLFRTEYNLLFGDKYTALQTSIPDVSEPAVGFGTRRDRQMSLTFDNAGTPLVRAVYFYRVDLGEYYKQEIPTVAWDIWAGTVTDPANAARLAAMTGLPVDQNEFIATQIVETDVRGPITVRLTGAPNSKFFKGTIDVEVTRAPHIADTIAPNTEFFF